MKVLRHMVAVSALASLLVISAPAAEGHHRPKRYCSPCGDICQSVIKVDGVRRLRIRTAERYFEVFHLCVHTHRKGYRWCAPYELRQRTDGTWGRSVAWFKQWPSMRHRGAFTVTWRHGGARVGKKLGFHRR